VTGITEPLMAIIPYGASNIEGGVDKHVIIELYYGCWNIMEILLRISYGYNR